MEYLRPGQACAKLGISVPTLRRWIENGRLKAIRLPTSGERRIPQDEVDRLLLEMQERAR